MPFECVGPSVILQKLCSCLVDQFYVQQMCLVALFKMLHQQIKYHITLAANVIVMMDLAIDMVISFVWNCTFLYMNARSCCIHICQDIRKSI